MAALRPLGDGLFVVDGPVVRDMGVHFTTRMSVVKLSTGDVWVSSPVEVPFDVLTEIRRLGPVRYLVSATPRHFWRLYTWHTLFPEAELWSSPLTPITLKHGSLPLTGIVDDSATPPWGPDLDHVLIRGSSWLNEVAFFHRPSRTLLMEDVIQIHATRHGHPLRNALIELGGVAAPGGGVGRDIRATFRDRDAARASVKRILAWDFDTLVIAHGPVVTRSARKTVENAFSWLIQ